MFNIVEENGQLIVVPLDLVDFIEIYGWDYDMQQFWKSCNNSEG